MVSAFKLPFFGSLILGISIGLSACKPTNMPKNPTGNPTDKPSSQSKQITEQPPQPNKLSPTGLTLVCCDSNNRVIDTVVVVDNGKSGHVEFSIPDGIEEIRVFAIGDRIDNFFKSEGTFTKQFMVGRPQGQPNGFGFLEASIDLGLLSGLSPGNAGMLPLELNDSLKKQIEADIQADQRADSTTVMRYE